jgi:tetratricopeptide (TPR) repeat protein
MKKNLIVLVIALLSCTCNVCGQSFKAAFEKALNEKDMTKAEKILQDWDMTDANDADLYVSYFNFYTLKSMEKDSTAYDKEYTRKALDFISEGIERFPVRLDMRLGKIYMLEKLNDYDTFTNDIIDLIRYSKKTGNNWKGEGFRLVDKPDEMLYGAVQDFLGKIFAKNDTALDGKVIAISEEMLANYPDHTQSLLNISTVNIKRKDYDKSLEALLKADKIKPDDSILKYNIAYVYQEKGDKENAKKYYKFAVDNAKEKESRLKEAAQKQLDALK